MKDLKFAEEITALYSIAQKEPERFNAQLDLKLHDCSREEMWTEFSFESREWCLNPYGGVHGGVICSMIDTAMGFSCASYSGKYVSTTDLTVSYLKPMMGKSYIIHVDLTHAGSRMIRCMAKVSDADSGMLCATGMASFFAADNRPKGVRV